MKRVAGGLAQLLGSPFAGVYTFVALLILALFTGESDPMGFILGRLFPPGEAYGVSMAKLHPLSTSGRTPQGFSDWLVLIRHSVSATHTVELVDSEPGERTDLALGAIDGVVVPRDVRSAGVPRSLAEFSLPGETVATILVTAAEAKDGKLTLLTPTEPKRISAGGDLIFFSPNELRNLRAVYFLSILAAALLGITLPKFGKLPSRSAADLDSDAA